MADLYLICAGKGSRMGGNVPKALVPITDEPNLTTTLKQIGSKFDTVYVVTNIDIHDQWSDYFKNVESSLLKNVTPVQIKSGLGDGHAVLESLKLTPYGGTDLVIAWGDVFFQYSETIDELLNIPMIGSGVVPAVFENTPYVSLNVDFKDSITSASFSKLGEQEPSGYHDQSVFRFKRDVLISTLQHLHNSLWKKNRYITSNGELSLLYVFHYLYNESVSRSVKIYETMYPTLSFNTIEEVIEIQKEINQKWKNQS